MATDPHLKNIEYLLSPQQGESSGYITRDDLVAAFREALLAVAEQEIPQEAVVVGTLQQKTGKSGESLLSVVESLGDVLAQWHTNIDVMGGAKPRLPEVGGDPVPTTIAATVQVLNNLIQSLEAMGLVRDVRTGATPPVAPPPVVAITGLAAPTPPALAFTFTPANATIPADLAALVADAVVGDGANAGGQAAFARDQYIALADGTRATWDGTNWSLWTPPIAGIAPPTGVNNFEWTFLPVGSAPLADLATLKADAVVGDVALSALGTVDFTTGQFIVLGDGSRAYFGADATVAGPAGGMSWQVGVAP